ncbi:hypothetical protein [Paraliobacillus sp. JSM ZJ581]|uniref:hypothetical protein n=1 Tax=Paraliobacillus sp. JSM ZJ581 TaxID=3342118 RepID=UPI0035A88546
MNKSYVKGSAYIKHKDTFIISFLLFYLYLSGCGTKNKIDFYKETENTDLSKEAIETVSIGSKEKEVISAFEKPDLTKKSKNTKSTYLIYGNALEFKIVEGIVERYSFTNRKYQTDKGIYIGSSKEDVIEAYGDSYYETTDTGANIIGYFDKSNQINIEFSLDSDVIGILVTGINRDIK